MGNSPQNRRYQVLPQPYQQGNRTICRAEIYDLVTINDDTISTAIEKPGTTIYTRIRINQITNHVYEFYTILTDFERWAYTDHNDNITQPPDCLRLTTRDLNVFKALAAVHFRCCDGNNAAENQQQQTITGTGATTAGPILGHAHRRPIQHVTNQHGTPYRFTLKCDIIETIEGGTIGVNGQGVATWLLPIDEQEEIRLSKTFSIKRRKS